MVDDPRTRLLQAAGPIFAEKGYQAATVREICDAAGVNIASVNYHFGDKRNLYIEAVMAARCHRADKIPFPTWAPDATAEEKLRGFIHTMLTRLLSDDDEQAPWQHRLMMREILQPTEACRKMVEEDLRPDFDFLLAILDELLPAHTPRHRRHQTALSIVGQCVHYRMANEVVAVLVGPKELAEHYTVESLTDHIFAFSIAALRNLGKNASSPTALQN